MSVNLYEPFTNPITGETFECISFSIDCYRMKWIVAPNGYVPLEHVHYFQDEIFTVKSGSLKLRIEGKDHLVNPGEKIVVPKGSAHIAANNGNIALECEVDYVPGLDYYTFFQCFIGLQKDKNYNKKGQISIPKMAFFMYKTNCKALARPTSVPKPMFNFVINFFGIAGSFAGWHKQLRKYINPA